MGRTSLRVGRLQSVGDQFGRRWSAVAQPTTLREAMSMTVAR